MSSKISISIFAIASLLICKNVQAQNLWRLGFGVSSGVATSDPFKYTLGGDVRLQKNLSNRLAATISAGFTHFFEKDHFNGYSQYGSPYNVIPVKAGLKLFATDNLYLSGEAGVGLGFEQWETSLLWSPGIGLAFKNGIDLSVRYEDFTRGSVTKDVSVRLAYGLDLNRHTVHKKTDAGSDWQLGVALNTGVAVTDGFVMGGEAGIYKQVSANLEAFATAGYTRYFSDVEYYPIIASSGLSYGLKGVGVIPVKAGLRAYLGNKFYISGDAGVAFTSDGETTFTYSPALGLQFKSGFNIAGKYDAYTNYVPNTVSLKLGYHFKL